MNIHFVAQPFEDGRDLAKFLAAVAEDEAVRNLDIVVAWAKRSGLHRLREHLQVFRGRSGKARLIVGIDHGGTTRQGLELALELFDTVHVFHDAEATFHPKLYVAWGDRMAHILAGSHNATAGGAYRNYEAGIECTLDLPNDNSLLISVQQYVMRLYEDTGVCKALKKELFGELLANPRYKVGDEEEARRKRVLDAPESGPSVFGVSKYKKRADPLADVANTTRSIDRVPPGSTLPPSMLGSGQGNGEAPGSLRKLSNREVAALTKDVPLTDLQRQYVDRCSSELGVIASPRVNSRGGKPGEWINLYPPSQYRRAMVAQIYRPSARCDLRFNRQGHAHDSVLADLMPHSQGPPGPVIMIKLESKRHVDEAIRLTKEVLEERRGLPPRSRVGSLRK